MSDFGKGIPTNVKKVHPDISDGEAVILATKEGFTTQSTHKNRGVGLFYLKQVITKNGGDMSIRSGRAHIFFSHNHMQDLSGRVGYYAGTLFEISLRTDSFDTTLADEEVFEW